MVEEVLATYLPTWLVQPTLFFVTFTVFAVIGSMIIKPLVARMIRRSDKNSHLAKPLSRAVFYVICVLGIGAGLIVGRYEDIFGVMGTVLAAATVAIGFAMKDTISAFVAGVSIFFDKPFKIGDNIEWGEFEGRVTDIRLRSTKVETYDNELLTVPNDQITNTTVKNLSARPKRRHELIFGVGYDQDIEHAKYLIHRIAVDHEAIPDEPNPTVRIKGLGDTTVDLRLRFWVPTEGENVLDIKDELQKKVKDAFERENIDMPFPTYTIAGDSLNINQ